MTQKYRGWLSSEGAFFLYARHSAQLQTFIVESNALGSLDIFMENSQSLFQYFRPTSRGSCKIPV